MYIVFLVKTCSFYSRNILSKQLPHEYTQEIVASEDSMWLLLQSVPYITPSVKQPSETMFSSFRTDQIFKTKELEKSVKLLTFIVKLCLAFFSNKYQYDMCIFWP